jgi:hypothetical protein
MLPISISYKTHFQPCSFHCCLSDEVGPQTTFDFNPPNTHNPDGTPVNLKVQGLFFLEAAGFKPEMKMVGFYVTASLAVAFTVLAWICLRVFVKEQR